MINQNVELIELNTGLKNDFLAMAEEFRAAGDERYNPALNDFDAFLERLQLFAKGENLPVGIVPANTFFLLADGKLIGRGDLRHRLNTRLAIRGGHIGYDVRPSERRKGFGSLILKLTLEKARAIGLERVFLTCDADNIASAKIIETHGGKLENKMICEETGKLISQYWIEL